MVGSTKNEFFCRCDLKSLGYHRTSSGSIRPINSSSNKCNQTSSSVKSAQGDSLHGSLRSEQKRTNAIVASRRNSLEILSVNSLESQQKEKVSSIFRFFKV